MSLALQLAQGNYSSDPHENLRIQIRALASRQGRYLEGPELENLLRISFSAPNGLQLVENILGGATAPAMSGIAGGLNSMGGLAPQEISGDFWGGLVGGIKGAATGLVGGGIGGAITGGIKGAITGSKGGGPGMGNGVALPPGVGGMGIGLPGAIGGVIGRAGGAIGKAAGSKAGKYIRSVVGGVVGYYVFDKALGWIFKEGNPPRRTMNVLNPRALGRANRRLTGFACKVRPVLRDLGFQVSSTRRAKGCGTGKKKKCR